MNFGHWQLNENLNEPEELPFGFVYCITNKSNGKFYIGQKKIFKIEKRPPLKGKIRKRKIQKETDWKIYSGSSNDLKEDIKKYGKDNFTFEIIRFCDSKWEMSYWELYYQMQNNVMLREDSYNGIINVRLSKFEKFIKKYQSENRTFLK